MSDNNKTSFQTIFIKTINELKSILKTRHIIILDLKNQ